MLVANELDVLNDIGLDTCQSVDDRFRALFPCFPYVYVKKYGKDAKKVQKGDKRQRGTHTWFQNSHWYGNVFDKADKDTQYRETFLFKKIGLNTTKATAPPKNYYGPYCYSTIQQDPEPFYTYVPWPHEPLPPKQNPKTMKMIVLDVDTPLPTQWASGDDTPAVVAILLNCEELIDNPAVIWCGSVTPDRYHIHLMVDEIDYDEASARVKEWLFAVGIKKNDGVQQKAPIETNVTDLDRILLPGQIPENMPCVAGHPEQPLCSTYKETKELFADSWDFHRKPLKDLLVIPEAYVKQKEKEAEEVAVIQAAYVPYVSEYDEEQKAKKKKHFTKKGKSDIRGLFHPIGCKIQGIRYALHSVEECRNEVDGLIFSSCYYPAVLRKWNGNYDLAYEEIFENRQFLRPESSSKDNPKVRSRHIRSNLKYWEATFDPHKCTKYDEIQALNDGNAQIDFHIRCKRDILERCQGEVKDNKAYLIKKDNLETYIATLRTVPYMIQGIGKYNGRVAIRSDKERSEYTFADSKCIMDFPCIGGSRRMADKVLANLRELGIFTSLDEKGRETANHWKSLCSRWSVCNAILLKCRKRVKPTEKGQEKKDAEKKDSGINPIKILPRKYSGTKPATLPDPMTEGDDYWCYTPMATLTFDESIARMKQKWLEATAPKAARIAQSLQRQAEYAQSLAAIEEKVENAEWELRGYEGRLLGKWYASLTAGSVG